jgi:hypothetical protein
VHAFTLVLDDYTLGVKQNDLFESSQFARRNVTVVVLTFISSGAATSIVGARHARTIVNGRKQANTPGLWNNFDF